MLTTLDLKWIQSFSTGPGVHKAFQNQDQDQAHVKKFFYYGLFLKTYNYLPIDCWYLIKYVLQTDFLEF